MDEELHHPLAFHNRTLKVFEVEVASGASILLHCHDQDTIAIAIGEQRSCSSASQASRTRARKMRTPRFGFSEAATCIRGASMGLRRITRLPSSSCTGKEIFTMFARKSCPANRYIVRGVLRRGANRAARLTSANRNLSRIRPKFGSCRRHPVVQSISRRSR